jgi:hypothetical protein
MEPTQMTKKVIDFQKMSFDHWYNAMSLIQDQAGSTMDMVLNQATWIPEEGRNALRSWVNVCQQERGRFKSYVDKGFSTLEKAVSDVAKPVEKSKKASGPSQS